MAQSFSKNFGLYGERIGALHVVTQNQDTAVRVGAVLRGIHRAEITSTPSFGARIIATIMEEPALHQQWLQDLESMSGRIKDMRKKLYDELLKRKTPGNWHHLLTDVSLSDFSYVFKRSFSNQRTLQIGMFSMTGLSSEKVATLKDKFHVYLLSNGRLSITGCK